jgi:hypothetical protein
MNSGVTESSASTTTVLASTLASISLTPVPKTNSRERADQKIIPSFINRSIIETPPTELTVNLA